MATKETPPVTIHTLAVAIVDGESNIVMRWCPHCKTETAQVGELPDGWSEDPTAKAPPRQKMGHCLQCIADGGICCEITSFSRWPDDGAFA